MNLLSKSSGIFRKNSVWSFGLFEVDELEIKRQTEYRKLFFMPGGELRQGLDYVHTNADPFLFVKDDVLYVFYESVSRNKKGIIKALCTKDLVSFSDLGVILKEDFHLSYPQVLEIGGQVHMIPESSEAGKVCLYSFRDFPFQPEISRVLLDGSYVDSSILFKDGIYYLFATSAKGLELHMSADPRREDFVPHPRSPVTSDPRHSRCGGRILTLKGELYRLAQDCSVNYGAHLNAMRISALSPDEYEEHPGAEGLKWIDEGWLDEGSHHFDWVEFKGRSIIATDGRAPVGLQGQIRSVLSRLKSSSKSVSGPNA